VSSAPWLVSSGGRRIAVEDAGPESGFPVLVHHGGTRHLFPGAVRDARAQGLRLIGYDRPGQGRSSPQPGRVVADCAEDVRAIAASFLPWGFDLGAVRAPVALWHGLRDTSPPAAHSRWLAERIPDVTPYYPAAEDHTNVEENNRAAAIAWVREHR
jgi:pimeloyl-ACP methyl ester carboxylesterase